MPSRALARASSRALAGASSRALAGASSRVLAGASSRVLAGASSRALAVLASALAALVLSLVASVARAEVPVPAFSGPVVDLAQVLTSKERAQLEARLIAYQKASGNQIAIVTRSDLEGEPVEDFAYRVFREWKLGDEARDSGILIAALVEDRGPRSPSAGPPPPGKRVRIWIEVGKGLSGDLTDLETSQILRQKVRPFLTQPHPADPSRARWGDAFAAAVSAIELKLSGRTFGPEGEAAERAPKRSDDSAGVVLTILFLGIFVLIAIRAFRGGGRGGGGPPIIFFGGFPGGFGGGGFGGGGGFSGGGGGESGGAGAGEDF
jgi:uncharacterized protein